ncbi:MAG: helix-turn-helix transcriptional regulator [Dysosmobacter sp.]|nr:helix-turn-helix transcriptional regulator [Dysosmobacter sp.]
MKKNMTQQELADKLGVNQCSISEYENNRAELTLPKLVRLADALEVTIYDLIGRDTA